MDGSWTCTPLQATQNGVDRLRVEWTTWVQRKTQVTAEGACRDIYSNYSHLLSTIIHYWAWECFAIRRIVIVPIHVLTANKHWQQLTGLQVFDNDGDTVWGGQVAQVERTSCRRKVAALRSCRTSMKTYWWQWRRKWYWLCRSVKGWLEASPKWLKASPKKRPVESWCEIRYDNIMIYTWP